MPGGMVSRKTFNVAVYSTAAGSVLIATTALVWLYRKKGENIIGVFGNLPVENSLQRKAKLGLMGLFGVAPVVVAAVVSLATPFALRPRLVEYRRRISYLRDVFDKMFLDIDTLTAEEFVRVMSTVLAIDRFSDTSGDDAAINADKVNRMSFGIFADTIVKKSMTGISDKVLSVQTPEEIKARIHESDLDLINPMAWYRRRNTVFSRHLHGVMVSLGTFLVTSFAVSGMSVLLDNASSRTAQPDPSRVARITDPMPTIPVACVGLPVAYVVMVVLEWTFSGFRIVDDKKGVLGNASKASDGDSGEAGTSSVTYDKEGPMDIDAFCGYTLEQLASAGKADDIMTKWKLLRASMTREIDTASENVVRCNIGFAVMILMVGLGVYQLVRKQIIPVKPGLLGRVANTLSASRTYAVTGVIVFLFVAWMYASMIAT